MKRLDALLDQITMYRLLLYYLIGLLGVAVILSLVGVLHISALDIVLSSLFILAVCYVSNKVFAYAFEAPVNAESPLITALILALIITPSHNPQSMVFMAAAAGLAVASKFMLAINKRHLFNPAAIAVVLTALGAGDTASWWVGTAWMLPFVLLGGVLLVRRVRRVRMTTVFVLATLVVTAIFTLLSGSNVLSTLQKEIVNSALFFAAFVMLTEPLTAPTTKGKQMLYAGLVGVLFSPQTHIFSFYFTPEQALVIGNIFAYIVGPRVKEFIKLNARIKVSPDTADFVWTPERTFSYQAGQYMEFTLQHTKTDSRGARRYFTLASSPTEPELRLGVKFYPKSSSYKQALLGLKAGDEVMAGQLGGDFVLPKNPSQKITFIAGGIGVTPYRSMLKYLLDTKQKRDITMLYAARTDADVVYRDVLEAARDQLGVRLAYFTGTAKITSEAIKQYVPDFADRLFYVSGPHGMVVAMEDALHSLGVPRHQIKKDFFSGYA